MTYADYTEQTNKVDTYYTYCPKCGNFDIIESVSNNPVSFTCECGCETVEAAICQECDGLYIVGEGLCCEPSELPVIENWLFDDGIPGYTVAFNTIKTEVKFDKVSVFMARAKKTDPIQFDYESMSVFFAKELYITVDMGYYVAEKLAESMGIRQLERLRLTKFDN